MIAIVTKNSTMPMTTRMPASMYCCDGRPDSGVTRYSEVIQPMTGSMVGVLKWPPAACTSRRNTSTATLTTANTASSSSDVVPPRMLMAFSLANAVT